MVPHSPHALDPIPTLSARVFQTSYMDDGWWPSYDRVRLLSSWLEHRPRLPHYWVDNNPRSSSSVQIICQRWMKKTMSSGLQLPQPCPNNYVLVWAMSYVLDGSSSGLYLLVTNKQGTSLIVVKCMHACRNCIYHTHACTCTHTHARTLILS